MILRIGYYDGGYAENVIKKFILLLYLLSYLKIYFIHVSNLANALVCPD